ncbi:hypothetical protein LINPERHAP2_LOCUS39236 [Linum perenne]
MQDIGPEERTNDGGGKAGMAWRRNDGAVARRHDDGDGSESNDGRTNTTAVARRRRGDGVTAPTEDGQKQRGQKLQHKESRRATQR